MKEGREIMEVETEELKREKKEESGFDCIYGVMVLFLFCCLCCNVGEWALLLLFIEGIA